jgi:hypothetical protein
LFDLRGYATAFPLAAAFPGAAFCGWSWLDRRSK